MSYKLEAFDRAIQKTKKELPKADPEKKKRIEKAKNDFWFFCHYYLSHKFFSEPAPYQKILLEIFNKRAVTPEMVEELKNWTDPEDWKYLRPVKGIKGIINIEPRGHGKTTRAEAYLLWNALFAKHKNIMVVAASKEAAEEILENIKLEVEENERIYEDFGEVEGSVWKSDRIKFKNGVNISGKGIDGRLRGSRKGAVRPDLILCDDLLKDEAAESATLREKIYRRFKRAVLPMADRDAFLIFTNTVLHHDDLPSRLLREYENGDFPDWFAVKFKAIIKTDKGEKALWESYWSLDRLYDKKRKIGSIAFATEYLNEPLSEEDMVFKPDWIQYYEPSEITDKLSKGKLEIVMAVDPATGKKTGDYSAIVTVGKDKETGIIYVLDAFGEKISDLKLINKIIEKYLAFRPKRIIFEEVVFQEIYKNQVMREASKKGIHLPVKGIKPKVNKEMRIQKLAPLVENGLIRFKKNQKLLIDQLVEFPKGAHDDLPDALVYTIDALEKKTGTSKFIDSLWKYFD
ncbi:phage terminase large subunit [Desulfurobacterium crinifex]